MNFYHGEASAVGEAVPVPVRAGGDEADGVDVVMRVCERECGLMGVGVWVGVVCCVRKMREKERRRGWC